MRHLDRANLRYPGLWRGCVGAWAPMLGPSGSTLRDQSGYGQHGTLTGMNTASDWVISGGNYALNYNGTTGYVAAPFRHGTNLNHLSLCGWAQGVGSDGTNNFPAILNLTTSATYASGLLVAALVGDSVATAMRFIGVDSGAATVFDISAARSATAWELWIGTYDRVTAKLYKNGVLVASSSVTTQVRQDAAGVFVGSLATSSQREWKGNIAECRVYSRAISEPEVNTLARHRGIACETTRRRSYKAAAAATTTLFRRSLVNRTGSRGIQ